MLYKLDNDTLRAAPRTLRHADGSVTCNPTDAQLLAAGYLPLADDSPPEYDEVTQYVETAFVRGKDRYIPCGQLKIDRQKKSPWKKYHNSRG